MTRLIDRLQDAGLVTRQRTPEDRRGAYAALTAKGRALRQRMWPVYQAAVEKYFGAYVSEREAIQIGEILARVARAVHEASRAAAGSDGTPVRASRATAREMRRRPGSS